MGESEVAVVRGMLDAYNSGDYETATAMLHEDSEFHQAAEVPDTRSYYGRDEFVRGIGRWASGFEPGFQFQPVEILDAGDRVLVRVRLRGRGRDSGVDIDQEVFQLYVTRDEQIYRLWVYWNEEEARREAGL